MSAPRTIHGRASDSEDDFDDFDSSSESESYLQNLKRKLRPSPAAEGGEHEQPNAAAINQTLITERAHAESERGGGVDVKRDDDTSPDWEDSASSDSESDGWLSYQRDTSVGGVTLEKSAAAVANDTDNLQQEHLPWHVPTSREEDETDQTITNNIKNDRNLQPVNDVTKVNNPLLFDKEKDNFVEKNIENYYQSVQLIRKDTFVKTVNNNIEKNSEDLLIDKNIRKISPKVLERRDTYIKSTEAEAESPQLNRKFNSVSPKKKNLTKTIVSQNKSLAKSLGDKLDNENIEIIELIEDSSAVNTKSGNKVLRSPQKRSREKPDVPVRRGNYAKPTVRPKSEAFLSSVTYEDKTNDLYASDVGLNNSVSPGVPSVQSVTNKEIKRHNSVNVEDKGNGKIDKELDKSARKTNFAFIRVSHFCSFVTFNSLIVALFIFSGKTAFSSASGCSIGAICRIIQISPKPIKQ